MTRLELRQKEINNEKVKEISKKLNLEELLVRILFYRDIDSEEKINLFLYGKIENMTNPFLYTNMDKAVERINKAIKDNERILVYGDYDCDGIGAIAIMYLAFKAKGVLIDYYIPSRVDEGYGLNMQAIEKIKLDFNPQLLITVDCGITSVKEIEYIKNLNMDIIITDHHKCADSLPECIIVNPCLNENLTPLCGAGVVFKLICALFGEKFASNYLDICAISTIADIVPLIGDNRIIAKLGMQAIKKGKCRIGIKQILFNTNNSFNNLSTYDVAFKIAPRLNASGRLASAYKSLNLLIEDDLTAVNLIAEELEIQNKERQQLNESIYEDAKQQLKSYDFSKYNIIIIKNKIWNEGVIGIVASKLAEEFNKPVILFTSSDGALKGSARSISTINLYDVLANCNEHLLRFGGHAMAAGMSIDESNFEIFREQVNQYINSKYDLEDFQQVVKYDGIKAINSFNDDLFNQLMLLEPYGLGNARPIFLDESLKARFFQIGKTNHIKMKTKLGDVVAFNSLDKMDYYNNCDQSILYSIDKNYFNGKEFNQFKVRDIISNGDLPKEEILFGRYLFTLISGYNDCKNLPMPKNAVRPILYIAFIDKTFSQFVEKNKGINQYIYSTNYISGKDSIVLSPNKTFPFEYYNRIVVLDSISAEYKAFLLTKVAFIETLEPLNDFNKRINLDSLREDYIFMSKSLSKPYCYTNAYNLYQYLKSLGYIKQYDEFSASFYTFLDVELIKEAKNGILIVSNNKVNLNKSKVYQYITRE
jgi:single-stranded-DNA-specific exonuclease